MTAGETLALALRAKRQAELIAASMDEVIRYLNNSASTDEVRSLKREDGRLTEAGIDALYADFAAAQLSNEQIMAKYGISESGLTKRKRAWKEARG